jgi:hypothetical protein
LKLSSRAPPHRAAELGVKPEGGGLKKLEFVAIIPLFEIRPPDRNKRLRGTQPWGWIKILRRSCANGQKNASGRWTIFSIIAIGDTWRNDDPPELTRLATAKGFGDDLARTVVPFGSVLQYVTHLFYMASFNSRSRAPDI